MRVRIERLVYNGYGMGRDQSGKVLFIPYTAPEDLVKVRITEEHRDFAFAEVVELLEPSPHRTDPQCPHFGICGACQWLHVDYHVQLREKENILKRELRRALQKELEVLPIIPSPCHNYRRRATLFVERRLIGFRAMRSHRVCGIGGCRLLTENLNRAILVLYRFQELLKKANSIWMGEDIESSRLLVLVKAKGKIGEIHRIYHQIRETTGVEVGLRVEYRGKVSTLGKDRLREELEGATVSYPFGSFFQNNRYLTPELVKEVLRLVPEGAKVLELFSGCGTFTIPIAKHKAKSITAVEVSSSSAEALKSSAEEQNISNVRVVKAEAERFLKDCREAFDTVIVDPPRTGLTEAMTKEIERIAPELIIYISCNPTTLARDMARLKNYKPEHIQPLDMFPNTFHLETVATLKRI